MCRTLLTASLVMTSISCFASNWHFAWAGNKDTRYFFDAESIERSKDSILVWVKTVQVNQVDSDGSWATAMRSRFNCSKRTIQILAVSQYDRDGKFLRSSPASSTESAVTPDSMGEAMLKIVCKTNFPNDKSGNDYLKVEGNDVVQATKIWADMISSQTDSAPK